MSNTSSYSLRIYGLALSGAVLAAILLILVLTGAFSSNGDVNFLAVLAVIVALMGIIGWICFRLQTLLVDPIILLSLKTKSLASTKEFDEPVRMTEAHTLPHEIHNILANVNQLVRELYDRDSKLTLRQAELVRLRDTVSVAREAKTNFIANINHEVRTPLNAIIGFSGVILDQPYGALDRQYIDFVKDIKNSGEQLLSLLSDIIALSRAELGTLNLRMEQFNALSVIEKCIQFELSNAQEKSITIEVLAPEKLPSMIADRVRFMQIVQHLLSNAIKYNNEGGSLTIHVSAESANNGVHFFRFIFQDTGIGISNEKIREVFVYSSPMEKGFKNHSGGKGLGLPLVKKLVEIHNGSLHIDSNQNGTAITVNIISDPGTLD
jgi:signal transduction histidine kinase